MTLRGKIIVLPSFAWLGLKGLLRRKVAAAHFKQRGFVILLFCCGPVKEHAVVLEARVGIIKIECMEHIRPYE